MKFLTIFMKGWNSFRRKSERLDRTIGAIVLQFYSPTSLVESSRCPDLDREHAFRKLDCQPHGLRRLHFSPPVALSSILIFLRSLRQIDQCKAAGSAICQTESHRQVFHAVNVNVNL